MNQRVRALIQLVSVVITCWLFVVVVLSAADWPSLFSRAIKVSEPLLSHNANETIDASSVFVTRVIDGDTVEIQGGERVRYIGIDAPEQRGSDGAECYATESTAANRALVDQQFVRLERDVRDRDRYGRLLRYVWIEDQLVNEVLVREGYAWQSSYPPDDSRDTQLMEAEILAREDRAGLWGACDPE